MKHVIIIWFVFTVHVQSLAQELSLPKDYAIHNVHLIKETDKSFLQKINSSFSHIENFSMLPEIASEDTSEIRIFVIKDFKRRDFIILERRNKKIVKLHKKHPFFTNTYKFEKNQNYYYVELSHKVIAFLTKNNYGFRTFISVNVFKGNELIIADMELGDYIKQLRKSL